MVAIMASMRAETRDPNESPDSRFCDPRLRISSCRRNDHLSVRSGEKKKEYIDVYETKMSVWLGLDVFSLDCENDVRTVFISMEESES